MSVLLLVVGAIATMLGVGMVAYGVPINEFSFGNTLIVAGTTTAVGGLIVIALGAVVGQLKRIAETLTARTSARPSRPLELFEPPAGPRAGQIPFPLKPRSETPVHEPEPPAETVADERPPASAAPMLRNPDMPLAAVEEFEIEESADVSLSPQQPAAALAPVEPAPPSVSAHESPIADKNPEPVFDPPWRSAPTPQERQSQTNYFDAMWPKESRPATRPFNEAKPESPLPPIAAPQTPRPRLEDELPVTILKSGVVDGMGYTLYVDGSIEAELPQGTLRFASIGELREHLAKS